jgi:hypothetical protein
MEIGRGQPLRGILLVAQHLRQSARETNDPHYIRLFEATASALELRAKDLPGRPIAESQMGQPTSGVDIIC